MLKASYEYAPQSDDEVKISEDQILLLLEKTDEEYVPASPLSVRARPHVWIVGGRSRLRATRRTRRGLLDLCPQRTWSRYAVSVPRWLRSLTEYPRRNTDR